MILHVTEAEVVEAAKLAITASVPMGLGFLHYNRADDAPDEAQVRECLDSRGINIDYFNGRMVKFWMKRNADGTWTADDVVRPDYQSWCLRYPSYGALFAEPQSERLAQEKS